MSEKHQVLDKLENRFVNAMPFLNNSFKERYTGQSCYFNGYRTISKAENVTSSNKIEM